MRRRNTRNWRGIALALGGVFAAGLLLVTVRQLQGSTRAKSRILIGRPRKEVFEAWSTLVNHPRFMRYVERVEDLGDGRSRWTARLPQTGVVQWIAEEEERIPGERIRWRTIEGQPLHHGGEVVFKDRGNDTLVELALDFVPRESIAQAGAALVKPIPKFVTKDDLRRFKEFVEDGGGRFLESQPVT